MSTDSNEVPVSVVDIDVPVTAIDDVLEEYEHNSDIESASITRTEASNSKGGTELEFCAFLCLSTSGFKDWWHLKMSIPRIISVA